jgi:carbamate kinase
MISSGFVRELPPRKVATLLTQVVVDASDPAFAAPSKPIGLVYDREQAERLSRERGFNLAPDGQSWRRAVPSPQPRRIVEIEPIRRDSRRRSDSRGR